MNLLQDKRKIGIFILACIVMALIIVVYRCMPELETFDLFLSAEQKDAKKKCESTGKGIWRDGKCQCIGNWMGYDCETCRYMNILPDKGEVPHGKLDSDKCVMECEPGWFGVHCSSKHPNMTEDIKEKCNKEVDGTLAVFKDLKCMTACQPRHGYGPTKENAGICRGFIEEYCRKPQNWIKPDCQSYCRDIQGSEKCERAYDEVCEKTPDNPLCACKKEMNTYPGLEKVYPDLVRPVCFNYMCKMEGFKTKKMLEDMKKCPECSARLPISDVKNENYAEGVRTECGDLFKL